MTSMKSILFAIGASILGATTANAVPVQYQLSVEAELRDISFGSMMSIDSATGRFERHNNLVINDAGSSAFDGFSWIEQARSTTGTLEFVYDADAPSPSGPAFTNCTGVLVSMCAGTFNTVDLDLGNLTSSNGLSFLTQLSASSVRYTDDQSYSWDEGTLRFISNGYGVNVTHDISSLSISAVPLPASLGFLLAGVGLLFGARHMRRRTSDA